MKYALQALENPWGSGPEGVANAIAFLRQAIAEAEQPDLARVGEVGVWGDKREWVGLTDEKEIIELSKDAWGRDKLSYGRDDHLSFYVAFARAIEAKLKEKNT